MHIFVLAFYLSSFIYGAIFDRRYLAIYFGIVGIYLVGYILTPSGKYNTVRRKIMHASWKEPEEPTIITNFEVDCTKVLEYIETYPKENRPSFTHVALKFCGEVLKNAPDVNGRIAFGKFVPYDHVNVSCLVDIGGGKDLAVALIEDIDRKNVMDIYNFLKDKAGKIRTNKDDDHKKRVGPMKLIPTFLIEILLEVVNFFAVTLGISVRALGISKSPFGGLMVTSLGMLNMRNGFAPFNRVSKVPMLVSVNEIVKKAVVMPDNTIQARPMCNINILVDHRFCDGGRSKSLNKLLYDMMDNPKPYCESVTPLIPSSENANKKD